MGEYQVIARKWRPQRFADVVGQEHVVKTLKNAIRQQRTAHAYLFVGPRGIGKTTTARIFAKALQCEAPEDGEPCCKCKSCMTIAEESNIDVIEIDAASQNSVDNIRELRDEVMHVPISGRYKIYIIDEVHMLSKAAWNALLKTVEEPPPHVKFIFATTEVHMVLPTIISRCQRFDLQPISSRLITDRLLKIAEAEEVSISIDAINAISRAADGGMRDAQSLLDQMIAFFSGGNSEISEDQVLSLFGLTASNELEALITAMLTNNRGGVVAAVHTLAVKGKNLETLFSDILNWLRGVQLCYLLSNPEVVLETDAESVGRYRKLGENVSPDVVQILLEHLSPVGRVLHDALNKQVFLETIILKAMREAHAVKIEHLIARLNQLRGAGDLKFIDKVTPVGESAQMLQAVDVPGIPEPQGVPAQPEVSEIVRPEEPGPEEVHSEKKECTEEPAKKVEEVISQPPGEDFAQPLPKMLKAEPQPEPPPVIIDEAVEEAVALSNKVVEEVTEEVNAAAKPQQNHFDNPIGLWHKMIEIVRGYEKVDPMLVNFMAEGTPFKFENSCITVQYNDEFEIEHFEAVKKALPVLHQAIQEITADWASIVVLEHEEGVKELAKKTEPEVENPVPSVEKKAVVKAKKNNLKEKKQAKIEKEQPVVAPENSLEDPVQEDDERMEFSESGMTSLMGDIDAVAKVKQNDMVKTVMDFFGAEVVDVHG
ncbi:MAG: DNA polymerase III subunit gamma/tau [Lentisphaerae bacterium]|nr:DNA polymerase III subunit gamma/tau [Lentisphaerota bacterium]MCP4100946.1 DNA polymerase III subunit gamma/tau [Lentisphaerota bacterium]